MGTVVWLSEEEMAMLMGVTTRHVRRLAASGELRTRISEQAGRNGKREREYDPSSLPAEAQLKAHELLLARATETTALVPAEPSLPQSQATLFASVASAGSGRLAVPPEKQKQAEARYRIIEPLIDWDRGMRPVIGGIKSKDQLATWLAQQEWRDEDGRPLRVSRATIWTWLKRWRESGDAGLVHDIRADKGTSRFFERHPHAAKFVLAKFAEGPLSDVLIYEALRREWPGLYRHGSQPPSLSTVRAFLKTVPNPLRDAARLTKQEHDNRHAPYLITAVERVRVNQIWVSDHRIYDVLVVNDCFAGAPKLAAIRLWETCIEDMRSRVIVGSVWNTTPSSRTIATALRQAISTYGLPEIFYCDNGKDFRKIGGGWANAPEDLDEEGRIRTMPAANDLLHRLGIKVQYCIPRHPQSKQVESYFSTVSKRFDVLFGKSYAGRKPALRPDACREAERLHHLFLKGERRESPFVPASYFVELHRQFTAEFNGAHVHSGRGMDGRAPLDVMNELLPAEKRNIPDMRALAPLFWDHVKRVVSNCTVQIDNFTYEAADNESAKAMYLANASEILVKRDPEDVGAALACDQDGQFLAYLRCQQLAERGPTSQDQIAAIQRFRSRLFRAGKQFWQLQQIGVPSELELLAQRAAANNPQAQLNPVVAQPKRLPAAVGAGPATAPEFPEDFARRWREED